MAEWKTYEEPELVKGDEYKAHEHVGAMILVKVNQHKEGIVTPNSPNGGPGIVVDLVDLGTDRVYRDVLFMGGAFVDGLKRYTGGLVVVNIVNRKSQSSGRTFAAPEGAGDAGIARGKAWIAKHGDPFTPVIDSPSKEDLPPF